MNRATKIASSRIAAFPLYDFPQLRLETDAFWRAIAKRLQDAGVAKVPTRVIRSPDYDSVWRDPRLIIGQACGYPLVKQLNSQARVIATPIYLAEGCRGFRHSSFFIVNAEAAFRTLSDLRGRTCAINGFDSNTGMNLLRGAITPLAHGQAFFDSVVVTGSHLASVEAVASGGADLAAIDCVTFAHLQRFEPDLTARVRQIGRSLLTPAPPFITGRETDEANLSILRTALKGIAADPELGSVRAALLIGGFELIADADYEFALRVERDAAAAGYPELR
jgi:ABC-type phosphate/phosphonate transport system substrate-binding protein